MSIIGNAAMRRWGGIAATILWAVMAVLGLANLDSATQEIVLAAGAVTGCVLLLLPGASETWRRGAAAGYRAATADEHVASVTELRRTSGLAAEGAQAG